jgi:PilX N-terminal
VNHPIHSRARRTQVQGQRGLATLVVVMLLFFIVALVAAYANRNLVFEQRTSANQYRSTQALEAAEAGMQWTLAMLNAGRVDNACAPAVSPAQSFRSRFIATVNENREATLITTAPSVYATFMPRCTFDAVAGRWVCLCAANNGNALPAVVGDAPQPFFRILFGVVPGRIDVLSVQAVGCTRPDVSCLGVENPQAPDGDAMATVTALVTLRTGLATIPGAAITAEVGIDGGASASGQGPLTAVNADPGTAKFAGTNGITFMAGDKVKGNLIKTSLPGQPGYLSVREDEQVLKSLTARAGPPARSKSDRLFSLVFGMWPETYQVQPSVVQVVCAATCTSADIAAKALAFPGHALWVPGGLIVDGDIGAAPAVADPTTETLAITELASPGPVLLIVDGALTLQAGTVVGLVYHRAPVATPDWNLGLGGTTEIVGALVTEGSIVSSGTQKVTYDAAVLNRLHTRVGSYVRVPGGWKDF